MLETGSLVAHKLPDPRKRDWLCPATHGGKSHPFHHFCFSLQTSDILAKQGKPPVVRGIYQHRDQAERRGEHVYQPRRFPAFMCCVNTVGWVLQGDFTAQMKAEEGCGASNIRGAREPPFIVPPRSPPRMDFLQRPHADGTPDNKHTPQTHLRQRRDGPKTPAEG